MTQALRSEEHALGLLPVKLDVLDDEHPDEGKSHHSSTADDHVLLGKRVRLLNRKAGLGALRVAKLQVQVFVDALPIWESLCRQEALQRTRKCALPDRATDGTANRTTNVAEYTEEGQRTGCVLVIRGREDSNLLYDDHSTTSKSEEDLTHDKVANFLVGLAEVDHKSLAEHVKGHGPVQDPAEAAGPLDSEADDEEPDTRHDVEDR